MCDTAFSDGPRSVPFEIAENLEVDEGHRLAGEHVAQFVLAGNARFTIVSRRTGARFTYRIRAKKDADSPTFFVAVLTGPDNEADYEFLGTLFGEGGERGFFHGKKSRIARGAPSAKAFAWFWHRIAKRLDLEQCEVWHLSHCGRCGRDLTTPESIALGIGPDCAEMMGI